MITTNYFNLIDIKDFITRKTSDVVTFFSRLDYNIKVTACAAFITLSISLVAFKCGNRYLASRRIVKNPPKKPLSKETEKSISKKSTKKEKSSLEESSTSKPPPPDNDSGGKSTLNTAIGRKKQRELLEHSLSDCEHMIRKADSSSSEESVD